MSDLNVLEICAGAGGQAIGLESAGFRHMAAVDIDPAACNTLRLNRPDWKVIEDDIANLDGRLFKEVDLLAGGLPCPPFSVAGKQQGDKDERNLFPQMLRIISEVIPAVVLIENVPGFASTKFDVYRNYVIEQLKALGYEPSWQILNASDFGVPQLRPRFVLVAFRGLYGQKFVWPQPSGLTQTVSQAIGNLIGAKGWKGTDDWLQKANKIAPTLVGGSKKHGGPDLGPTRAKKQWEQLGVDGHGLSDSPPDEDFPIEKYPRLTVEMTARIQSFPDTWKIFGKKTPAYRQVGNAFPPLVAEAVGNEIVRALSQYRSNHSFNGIHAHNSYNNNDNGTHMTDTKTARRQGSKAKILDYFLANMGRIIEGKELQEASGNKSEWARRVRELRDEEGYQILTHKDRADLKPGQYILETNKRKPVLPRSISKETRAYVLERNGYTCQMCGLAAGDPDPFNSERTVRLTMGHIIDKSKGGRDTPDNLRAICTNCNEGLQNTAPPKPDRIWLLSQVRRATIDDQLVILEWLEEKYKKIRPSNSSL